MNQPAACYHGGDFAGAGHLNIPNDTRDLPFGFEG